MSRSSLKALTNAVQLAGRRRGNRGGSGKNSSVDRDVRGSELLDDKEEEDEDVPDE